MSEELVKRLRNSQKWVNDLNKDLPCDGFQVDLCALAADTIEQLEKDKAELLDALVSLEIRPAPFGGYTSDATTSTLGAAVDIISKHKGE
jgi:hypothetical protein